MKTILTTAFIFLFCLCGFAYADCPPGTQTVVNTKTGEVLCFTMPNASPSYVDASEVEMEEEQIAEGIRAAGFTLDFGIGYAVIGAIDFRVMAGYQFPTSADGIAFGLYTNFNGFLPYPYGLTWDISPTVHVFSQSFRVSLGLGFGIFGIHDNDFFSSYDDDYDEDDNDSALQTRFMLKPSIRFDWFLTQNVMIGLNFDMPLYFDKQEYKDYDYDKSSDKYTPKKKTEIEVGPWFTMTVNVGYKF